jgi:hypothetical protein
MLIKILSAATATVLLVAVAALLLSCQDSTTTPTPPPESKAPSVDVVRIWGYVENGFGVRLNDVEVDWWCETCSGEAIGSDAVDDQGRYDIDELQSTWNPHSEHDLKGMAHKDGYTDAFQTINEFNPYSSYRRDFVLYEE